MARSKEQIIADLVVLQIDYDEEMSYKELCGLLAADACAKAKADAEVAQSKVEEPAIKKPGKKAKAPLNTDLAGTTCGLRTTQNQEMRIRVIEYKLGINP